MQGTTLIILVISVSSIIIFLYLLLKPKEKDTERTFNAEYYRGLNYLLNNEEDKAFKVFTALMDVDSSTIETHLALGGLYRRRGEFDRAILIHQNLLSRPTLESELKNQAFYELAKDYFSAGLYDRSEKIFLNLSENKVYRHSSLDYLLRIYEVIKDWDNAIKLAELLETEGFSKENPKILLAQYYCEISEKHLNDHETNKFLAISKKALKINKSCVRAAIQLGDYYSKDDLNLASQYYLSVLDENILFGSYVVKKIIESAQNLNNNSFLDEIFKKLISNKDLDFIPEIYTHINYQEGLEAAHKYVDSFKLKKIHNNFQLSYTLLCTIAENNEKNDLLNTAKISYDQIISDQLKYICRKCGYKSNTLNWFCPSCNSWETIVPNLLTDILETKSE
ncbi:MAG: hypothetical protein VYE31_03145 [Pseudomonadota bacterium]|nr:hypothetical protein [Pseudomonadota bacterium]